MSESPLGREAGRLAFRRLLERLPRLSEAISDALFGLRAVSLDD